MRAILDACPPPQRSWRRSSRSAPTRRSSAILLDIDGTLAPIVRHAADAHVPEATRTLLIEIAKRYRRGRLRQRPPRRHRAPDRRDRHDRVHRQPRRRAAAPSLAARPEVDPELAALDRARARVRGARRHRRAPAPARAREDKDAIAAFHWRGAPDEDGRGARGARDRAPGRGAGLRGPLGPQGARGAPAGRASTRGSGSQALLREMPVSAALYVGRRHDRPRRLPRAARAGQPTDRSKRRCA